MNKGYVYIARIIDHGGKFVNGYHKIGLSKQYKVRETQLNSTHLPFDVLMVRVFEAEDMKKLEGLLHICFEDYRVVKEYDYRKNITTEWFDVSDIDMFNTRLDKFIELMDIVEVDMGESIDNDATMTQSEKVEAKERVGKAKAAKLNLKIGDEVYTNGTQKDLFIRGYKYVCDTVGHEKVAKFDRIVRLKIEDFSEYKTTKSGKQCSVYESTDIVDLNGSFLWCCLSANDKIDYLTKTVKYFGITDVNLYKVD